MKTSFSLVLQLFVLQFLFAQKPTPDFVADKTTITVGDTVQFINVSMIQTGLVFTFWYLEGGSPDYIQGSVGSADTIYVRYDSVGLFNVTLQVNDNNGDSITTKVDFIQVLENVPEEEDSTGGNEEEDEPTFIIYSEISNNTFNVRALGLNIFEVTINRGRSETLDLEIYNMNGQKVSQKKWHTIYGNNHFIMDLSDRIQGFYLLGFREGNLPVYKKLFVE